MGLRIFLESIDELLRVLISKEWEKAFSLLALAMEQFLRRVLTGGYKYADTDRPGG